MKKETTKKLTLHRETIQNLTDLEAIKVMGGISTTLCPSCMPGGCLPK